MAVKYITLDKLALAIVKMLLSEFDCFMVIEGHKGLGKSTLAFLLLKKINNMFRIIVSETGKKESPYLSWYEFKPQLQLKNPYKHKYILYKQEDVINFYDKRHRLGIADEMINVAFNREFFSLDQKNLIKMLNMNRDHGNVLCACVPRFQALDVQVKDQCKIRITVVRRGLAVMQTQNKSIYLKDSWDSANNERIEREWLRKGTGLPKYSKLNTYRGMIRFPKLNKKDEAVYKKIKDVERNRIKKDLGVQDAEGQMQNDPYERFYQKLINGSVRSSVEVEGSAFMLGITQAALIKRLTDRLKKENRPHQLSLYYWDKKAKEKPLIIGIKK